MALRENPALAGALIGLGIGLVKYMFVLSMIGGAVGREIKENASEDLDLAGFAARMRPIRRALLVVAFGVLPVVGFIAGSVLGK
jgi:hypothetical protein